MRKIILDTETTGLTAQDKVIEIACLEFINGITTGKMFHTFLNPDGQAIHPEAFAVHKISSDMLEGYPKFSDIYQEFTEFIKDASLIAHNASFDIKMLNQELLRINQPIIDNEIIDTLKIARQKFPGASVSIDRLCKRFKINAGNRHEKHDAITDCKLLSQIYLILVPEESNTLFTANSSTNEQIQSTDSQIIDIPKIYTHGVSEGELLAHQDTIDIITKHCKK